MSSDFQNLTYYVDGYGVGDKPKSAAYIIEKKNAAPFLERRFYWW